jgi:hypothetical protein
LGPGKGKAKGKATETPQIYKIQTSTLDEIANFFGGRALTREFIHPFSPSHFFPSPLFFLSLSLSLSLSLFLSRPGLINGPALTVVRFYSWQKEREVRPCYRAAVATERIALKRWGCS